MWLEFYVLWLSKAILEGSLQEGFEGSIGTALCYFDTSLNTSIYAGKSSHRAYEAPQREWECQSAIQTAENEHQGT